MSLAAPCKPTAVSLDLNCDTNDVVVSWEGTGPNQEQEVIAKDFSGNTINCISSSLQCNFTGLTCGLRYDVTVVSKSGSCNSNPTTGPMLLTGTAQGFYNYGLSIRIRRHADKQVKTVAYDPKMWLKRLYDQNMNSHSILILFPVI